METSFEERAAAFLVAIKSEEGFEVVRRGGGHDVSTLKVGIAEHEGLVFKEGKVFHPKRAHEYHDALIQHFTEREYDPSSYELVKPEFMAVGESKGVIQEYFPEPSLDELGSYLSNEKRIRNAKRGSSDGPGDDEVRRQLIAFYNNEDRVLRCEKFLRAETNKDVTLEQIAEVRRELLEDAENLNLWVKTDNVITVGQRESDGLQKITLAIIDY